MLENLYYYRAELIRVIDGDSLEMKLDRGFKDYSIVKTRLARINAPEIRGETKEKGLEAKARTEKLLGVAKDIIVRTTKLDGFGRAIAEVYLEDERGDWRNLSDDLVVGGFAVYRQY